MHVSQNGAQSKLPVPLVSRLPMRTSTKEDVRRGMERNSGQPGGTMVEGVNTEEKFEQTRSQDCCAELARKLAKLMEGLSHFLLIRPHEERHP